MKKNDLLDVSRRERQILDILFREGSASAAEIHGAMPDPPSYSAVRAALSVLERKGHIRHELQGLRYVWKPSVPHDRASRSALRHIVHTYFGGSAEQAVAALLAEKDLTLNDNELARLQDLIDKARGQK